MFGKGYHWAVMCAVIALGSCAMDQKKAEAEHAASKHRKPALAESAKRADASGCIRLLGKDSGITWDHGSKLVGIKLVYANICKSPVKCDVAIVTGTIKKGSDPAALVDWRQTERQQTGFELPGGKQLPIQGGVRFEEGSGTTPVIRFP
ncbi:MAG: hypothetical protein D6698_05790, partial [Gammaproteobacteria bacterium]